MKGKLIRVERTLNIYNKKNKLLREIIIDIPVELLVQIVMPEKDDPLLYDGYELNLFQLQQINALLKSSIQIDLNNKSYYLVAGGTYDWE